MHKFRGSSCLSHTSQSEDVFHSFNLLSKLWSICCHQLPKRGRICIDLSFERESFVLLCPLDFFRVLLLLFVWWYFVSLCVLDTMSVSTLWATTLCDWSSYALCNAYAYHYPVWSFTCVGDACLLFHSYHFARSTKLYVKWKSDPWAQSIVHLHSNANS